jgi:heme oxygenase
MKTAVEFHHEKSTELIHQYLDNKITTRELLTMHHNLFYPYKEMEKQQIIHAFDEGQEYEYQYHINNAPKFDSETYYQETFKS